MKPYTFYTDIPRVPNDRFATVEHLASLPELGRDYELASGRISYCAEPDYLHGKVQGRIFTLLDDYVMAHSLGDASQDVDLILARGPDTMRRPDIVFVSADRMPLEGPAKGKYWEFVPDFAIEVRSLSERPGMIADKIRDFQDAGIPLVWVVDPHYYTVTVYELGKEPREVKPPAEITAAPVLPDFKCAVATLLSPPHR